LKALFDTSVLVATFLGDHEHHGPSLNAFLRYAPREAGCAAHSLAEFYAVLTRLPGKHRVLPDHAMLFVGELRARLALVALDGDEYCDVLEHASADAIAGGAIYDALVVQCAVKAQAEIIYTWNAKHFEIIARGAGKRIRVP